MRFAAFAAEAIAAGISMSTDGGSSGADLPHLQGVRVLLVEDSWQLGMALKSLLRSLDAEVDGPAATTADAERLIAERVPHIALVDINLRGGERAYGLIDRLIGKGIPVIVTSGYSDLPMVPEKVVGILQKPLNEEQLFAILRSVVGPNAPS
jgi:DNA-binding NtrC family response regulator